MIAFLELVLDENRVPPLVAGDDVRREGTDGSLGADQLQFFADGFAETIELDCKPWGEVQRLVSPHCARIDRKEPTDFHHSAPFFRSVTR